VVACPVSLGDPEGWGEARCFDLHGAGSRRVSGGCCRFVDLGLRRRHGVRIGDLLVNSLGCFMLGFSPRVNLLLISVALVDFHGWVAFVDLLHEQFF
jgi:hypothetical protein